MSQKKTPTKTYSAWLDLTDGTRIALPLFRKNEVLAEAFEGQYRIVVRMHGGVNPKPCYEIFRNGEVVPSMTRDQERRYPKRAAHVGNALVKTVIAQLASERANPGQLDEAGAKRNGPRPEAKSRNT